MTWTTTRLTLSGFAARASATEWQRRIAQVHLHHTWKPDHAAWAGEASIHAMRKYHMKSNGWSDIAQHVTIAPDGGIWTGRDFNKAPASSGGHNGNARAGPFMLEVIGNFDVGCDPFAGAQKRSALGVVAVIQRVASLKADSLRFHRQLNSPKTCPGSAVDYEATLAELLLVRTGLLLEV